MIVFHRANDPTRTLNFIMFTFGSSNADWTNQMACPEASCGAYSSEAVLVIIISLEFKLNFIDYCW